MMNMYLMVLVVSPSPSQRWMIGWFTKRHEFVCSFAHRLLLCIHQSFLSAIPFVAFIAAVASRIAGTLSAATLGHCFAELLGRPFPRPITLHIVSISSRCWCLIISAFHRADDNEEEHKDGDENERSICCAVHCRD